MKRTRIENTENLFACTVVIFLLLLNFLILVIIYVLQGYGAPMNRPFVIIFGRLIFPNSLLNS